MRVSELLVRSLESYGVERAYGLVGTSILEVMDALRSSKIRYVSTRHEQVAVSMADAEGRVTGRPGVAVVHGGPGFLNSLVSLSNAWKDGSPLLLVSGAVKRRMVGMDSWLEIPQSQMAEPIVKGAWRLENGAEAGAVFSEAFSLAASPPAGPVLVEVPEDVWNQQAGEAVEALRIANPSSPNEEDLEGVAASLAKAKRPLLVAGGGINSERGAKSLAGLLAKVQFPVATTGNGRGTIPEDHPLALGRIGFGGGSGPADAALANSDLVLCLGCGLSDVSTYGFGLTPKGEVLAVNLDPIWEKKAIHYSRHVEADAPMFAERLGNVVKDSRMSDSWAAYVEGQRASWKTLVSETKSRRKKGFVNPAKFLSALDGVIPRDSIIAAGQGLHVLYAYAFVKVRTPRGYLAATNMGSMGFVFPGAMGAKMAFPDREVVAVMGDGEFAMTMQDLETAVRERIGVKIVVVNDNSYRVLLMRQKIQKMGRVFGTTHSNPDIVKLADAFGAEAVRVDSDDEIGKGVGFLAKKADLPLIVDLKVDPEDLPPLNLQASLMF